MYIFITFINIFDNSRCKDAFFFLFDNYIASLLNFILKFNFNLIIRRNVSWAANLLIRMISEGSYGTEDWSNVCWKFSFLSQE